MTRTREYAAILTIAILYVACSPAVSHATKVERALNINVSSINDEFTKTNEVPLNLEEFHDKPSRFDENVEDLVMTDNAREEIAASGSSNSNNNKNNNNNNNATSVSLRRSCWNLSCLERDVSALIDGLSRVDEYNVTESVQIVRRRKHAEEANESLPSSSSSSLMDNIEQYAKEHVVRLHLPREVTSPRSARLLFGSFGLKKLLLPLIFGVQVIKTILIALFLPSIVGSLTKIVGKSIASFAQSSQGAGAMQQQPEENFEFKDNQDFYNDDYMTRQPVGTLPASSMFENPMTDAQKTAEIASRLGYANRFSDRYYTRHMASAQGAAKRQDFKVFHEIPTSSLLLTNYDPFYSPLLSRLDAIFSRIGHTTEGCREYSVCAMYRTPARYAPYSNLVSAQLSRELNELRKPSSDNPDVLRFFRYMKAAKDGQDGVQCEEIYADCAGARDDQSIRQNQAMLATYQDIDKLVQARKI